MLEEGAVRELLREVYDYPSYMMEGTLEKIRGFDPAVRAAFEAFVRDGTLGELQYEGYTAKRLMEEFGVLPVAAFLLLDDLCKRPRETLEALRSGIE